MKTSLASYGMKYDIPNAHDKFYFKNEISKLFLKNTWILLFLAFFVSRASCTSISAPIAVSVIVAAFGFEASRLAMLISIVLGLISAGSPDKILGIVTAIIILYILYKFITIKGKEPTTLSLAISAFVAVFIPGFIGLVLNGILIYDFFSIMLSSLIVLGSTFTFRSSFNFLFRTSTVKIPTNSQVINLAITGALFIMGFFEINVMGISLKSFFCILMVLIFSYRYGAGVGAAIGVVTGIVYGVSGDVLPITVGVYAFCGVLAGMFKKLGKLGVSFGFILGNAIFTFFFNGSAYSLIHIKEIIIAIPFFLIIPNKTVDFASRFLDEDIIDEASEHSSGVKDIAVEKLNMFSEAFKELASTFGEISETKFIADKQDLSVFFDRAADKVCKTCVVCSHCWDRNFFDTYQIMYKIVERLETKGFIDKEDIPEDFYERCGRIRDFIDAINNTYEVFKIDMVWKSKIGESRGLVSQQMNGVSKAILKLAEDIGKNIHILNWASIQLKKELIRANIRTKEVIVYKNKNNKCEVRIFFESDYDNTYSEKIICEIASYVLDSKMAKKECLCSLDIVKDMSVLELTEEENIGITCGVARASKSSVRMSGDSYTFMNGEDGKYFIALSDGMGSGQRANVYSRAAIDLLEKFIQTGFDKDEAIKLINSALVLKSGGDSFATIDLSVVDLYDGEVEFIKIGAVPTLIKKCDGVEIIKAASLPAGILSNIHMELVRKRVGAGDFIIMMTDGVYDCFDKKGGKAKVLTEFINNIESLNPQEIADIILEQAHLNIGDEPLDDMLVVVAKIWKRI